MGSWDICLLTDGKCDGSGYGGKATPLSRQQRESSSASNERMGEVILVKDDVDVSGFQSDCLSKYKSNVQDGTTVVNMYLSNSGSYKPYVLVTSCPGDAHGGAHSRVNAYTDRMRWKFAPVQFTNKRDADDWKRLWKIQVEKFACDTVTEGKQNILEVKIDGGGAGCATERSRNMAQWWIDWVKRLGADIAEDMGKKGASRSNLCPSDCFVIQIGQVVVNESDFLQFGSSGSTLSPVTTNGVEFEHHTLILNPHRRYWTLISDQYSSGGSSWSSTGRVKALSGVF